MITSQNMICTRVSAKSSKETERPNSHPQLQPVHPVALWQTKTEVSLPVTPYSQAKFVFFSMTYYLPIPLYNFSFVSSIWHHHSVLFFFFLGNINRQICFVFVARHFQTLASRGRRLVCLGAHVPPTTLHTPSLLSNWLHARSWKGSCLPPALPLFTA